MNLTTAYFVFAANTDDTPHSTDGTYSTRGAYPTKALAQARVKELQGKFDRVWIESDVWSENRSLAD